MKISKTTQQKLTKLPYLDCSDYDLKNSIKAIAFRSENGEMSNLYRSCVPEDYSLHSDTKLKEYLPELYSLYESQLPIEKGRIRIFSQEPEIKTSMHLDYDNNSLNIHDTDYQYRIWICLSDTPDSEYYFKYKNKVTTIKLDAGDMIVFNPDKVYHGSYNKDKNTRYSLHINCKSNEWFKRLLDGIY